MVSRLDLGALDPSGGTNGQVATLVGGKWAPAAPSGGTSGSGGEVLMADGVTAPPEPLENEDRDDWLYSEVPA